MATSSRRRQSRWFLRLPPLIVEDPLSSSELDSPSSGNQSPKSHIKSIWTTDDSSLPEDFFTEGFLSHFNPLLMNPLDPILAPMVLVLPIFVGGTFPSIPSMNNELWSFVDSFSPAPLPQSIVTTTLSMANPAIPFVPGTTTHMTPSMSGT